MATTFLTFQHYTNMKHLGLTLLLLCFLSSCTRFSSKSLVINEVCGKEFPDNEWVEIYNPTDSVVHLKGIYLIKVDENGIDHLLYRFDGGTLAPGQVYVISSMHDELLRHLSRQKELGIELVGPDDKTIDDFYRDEEIGEHPHPANGSYSRIPNGTGKWAIVKQASRGELNPDNSETVDTDNTGEEELYDTGEEE